MNVLFVYTFCGLGGVETSILNKLEALHTQGISARALFGEFYGSRGSSLASDPRVSIGFDRAKVTQLLASGTDVVSVIDCPGFIDRLDEIDTDIPVVYETHASFPDALARFYSRLDHPRVAAIVVPSLFNKRLVEAALKTSKTVAVIANPVDGKRFFPRQPRSIKEITLPSGGPLLVWVGRLEKEKNPIEFLQVGERLLQSRPDVRFLILGDTYNDAEYAAYRDSLVATIAPHWRERFAFCQAVPYGNMPDVYLLAQKTDGCLVSTSLFESAPMTFIEAMACGCPVLSSDVGGIQELVEEGVTGRAYQSGDISAAAEAIAELIDERRRSNRDTLVSNALAAVAERNSLQAVGRRYKAVLDSVANSSLQKISSHSMQSSNGSKSRPVIVPGLVSTIIPVYNRAELLIEAVASVLAQTYENIEVIIVDDGSTDETIAVCDRLAREHAAVKVLHIPHQGRAGLAREAGRHVAQGEFLQYLDSDDLLMPTKFAKMVAALTEKPDCDIAYCYTRRYRIGMEPPVTPAELTGQTFERMLPAFLSKRYWCTSTPIYRRRLCDKAGAWSDLPFWEDIEYDLRLATFNPRLCHIKDWLTEMRDHDLGRLSGSRFLDHPHLLKHAVRGIRLIYGDLVHGGLPYENEHMRAFIDDVAVVHNRCKDFAMAHEARECANIIMEAVGITDPERVGEYTVRTNMEPVVSALSARPGETVLCLVNLINQSTVSFRGGEFATELGYHLRAADGVILQFDNSKKIIEEPLRPGEARLIDLPIRAPDAPGLYYVELDVFWAACTWLNATGNLPAYVKLLVSECPVESRWRLHIEPGNVAEVKPLSYPADAVRVSVTEATTETPWHIQLNREPLSVSASQWYCVKFRARADQPRAVAVGVSRAHDLWDGVGLYREIDLMPEWRDFSLEFQAMGTEHLARIHFDAGGSGVSFELSELSLCCRSGSDAVARPPFSLPGRLQMDIGTQPLSFAWGTDRGLPVHRYYLEQFLTEFSSSIAGHCLEFQDPQYTPRFGGAAVNKLDILHIDASNPRATLVADLTKGNDLPDDRFDCVICTHVLHVILDVQRAISELHRILKPGGTLLLAVPQVSMDGPEYGELWRFTSEGLNALLSRAFGSTNVTIRAYGNSLTAAGEIRGVVSEEFLKSELDRHDPRFAVEVCAFARKEAIRE